MADFVGQPLPSFGGGGSGGGGGSVGGGGGNVGSSVLTPAQAARTEEAISDMTGGEGPTLQSGYTGGGGGSTDKLIVNPHFNHMNRDYPQPTPEPPDEEGDGWRYN